MKKRKILKILLVICIILLAVLFGGYFLAQSYYQKLNYKEQSEISLTDDEIAQIEDEMKDGVEDSDEESIKKAEEEILNNLKSQATSLVSDENVLNILLIGSDHRGDVAGSRSDCMMVLSINKNTKELVLTSFMRDCYVQIPGYQNNRLNAAYSFGGEKLLIETIENNFKIKIDKYAQVDFFAFMKVIDAIGGIDMDISEAEMECINDYIIEINNLEGLPADDGALSDYGNVHLNGKQALAFARIRYVGNADFERTERQRRVVNAAFEEVKNLSILEINDLLNIVLPEITTDLTFGEIVSVVLDLPEYKNYELVSNRVPYDGTFSGVNIRGMSVLSLDFEENITRLQEDIYNLSSENSEE